MYDDHTPLHLRLDQIYDPTGTHPDPFPPPKPDRLSPWLALLFWSLAALFFGAMLAYFSVPK